jgi:hypothetical protein
MIFRRVALLISAPFLPLFSCDASNKNLHQSRLAFVSPDGINNPKKHAAQGEELEKLLG